MKKINILLILIFFALIHCSSNDKKSLYSTKANAIVEMPSQNDLVALNKEKGFIPSKDNTVKIPSEIKIDKEECDGSDNDDDGMYDEGCFGCCPDAIPADFDCDGKVTILDCGFPILLMNNATVSKTTDISCADLNKDKSIDFSDVIACLQIMNGGGR